MRYLVKEKQPLPKSQLRLVLEIPTEEIAAHRDRALVRLGAAADLPGFRKGHVPKEIVRAHTGEFALWEEAAEAALQEALADFFRAAPLDVIGRPEVQILKLAPENPAEFRVSLSLYPSLTLPAYRVIAADERRKPEEEIVVAPSDIDAALPQIEEEHRRATGRRDFTLSSETVKEFGEFADMGDFRSKIREGIVTYQKQRSREKRRAALLDRLASETVGELPDLLIEGELARMEAELEGAVTGAGMTIDQYFTEVKKDRDTFREEWRADAEKRARLELLLGEIARAEGIVPEKGAIEEGMKRLRERHKDANEEHLRAFVATILRNQKVIEFLEQL